MLKINSAKISTPLKNPSLKKLRKKTIIKEMEKMLTGKEAKLMPKIGDLIKGEVIGLSKKAIYLDINGLTTGIVRGYELLGESREYSNLKIGDEVVALVLDLENESGEMELSFRQASYEKGWKNLEDLLQKKETISVRVIEANRGGLIVKFGQIIGFLPTSQLSKEYYPLVEGGIKNKILEKLKQLIGKTLRVKIIDLLERENKLVVSEKAAQKEIQEKALAKYKLGDIIEGEVSSLMPFGALVKFGENLEGLVHISEIVWGKINHPQDVLKIGQLVRAKIIGFEGIKVFLSIKNLIEDPWKKAAKKYKIGQKVKGEIVKIVSFGFLVKLDKQIQGLAHLSELPLEPGRNPHEIAKVGDVLEFKIINIEPEDHRLGLSLKALKEETIEGVKVQK